MIGRADEAEAVVNELVRLVPADDPEYAAHVLRVQADTAFKQKRYQDAIRFSYEAVQRALADEQANFFPFCQGVIARSQSKLGEHQTGLQMIEGVIEQFRSLNIPASISGALRAKAEIFCDMGRWDEALPLLREALAASEQAESAFNMYAAHHQLAKACAKVGDFAAAARHWVTAVRITREISAPRLEEEARRLAEEFPELLDVPLTEQVLRAEAMVADRRRAGVSISAEELAHSALISPNVARSILQQAEQNVGMYRIDVEVALEDELA